MRGGNRQDQSIGIRVDRRAIPVLQLVPMRSRNIPYIAGVDHLRTLAAVLIVFYHGQQLFRAHAAGGLESARYVQTSNPLRAVVCEGHTAVGLFMVLSGFIFAFGSRGCDVQWAGFMPIAAYAFCPCWSC